jgi:hypothetical protein
MTHHELHHVMLTAGQEVVFRLLLHKNKKITPRNMHTVVNYGRYSSALEDSSSSALYW